MPPIPTEEAPQAMEEEAIIDEDVEDPVDYEEEDVQDGEIEENAENDN